MEQHQHRPSPAQYLNRLVNGEMEPPPVARLVGFRIVSWSRGEAVMEMETGEQHTNPMGTVHGGILCDLSDAAMGMAYASTLEQGESFTTVEMSIHFLRPVWRARLQARARVTHQGKTLGVVDCDIVDQDERPVARVRSTCLTLRGEAATGR